MGDAVSVTFISLDGGGAASLGVKKTEKIDSGSL